MVSLETSLEANSDRQTDRQTEKATYRDSSYRSAQKVGEILVHSISTKVSQVLMGSEGQ